MRLVYWLLEMLVELRDFHVTGVELAKRRMGAFGEARKALQKHFVFSSPVLLTDLKKSKPQDWPPTIQTII